MDRIRSVQSHDQVILDTLKSVKDKTTLPMKSSLADWSFEGRLVFFREWCYVLPTAAVVGILYYEQDTNPTGFAIK